MIKVPYMVPVCDCDKIPVILKKAAEQWQLSGR